MALGAFLPSGVAQNRNRHPHNCCEQTGSTERAAAPNRTHGKVEAHYFCRRRATSAPSRGRILSHSFYAQTARHTAERRVFFVFDASLRKL